MSHSKDTNTHTTFRVRTCALQAVVSMCRRITCRESVGRHVPAVGFVSFLVSFWLLAIACVNFKLFTFSHTFHRRMSDNEDIDVDSDVS